MATSNDAEAGLTRRARLRRTARAALRPALGLAVITPLVFAGAVGATPRGPAPKPPRRVTAVTPLAAVAPVAHRHPGPQVVAARQDPTPLHVAAAAMVAPPPAPIVFAPGTLGIPQMALSAYRHAEQVMAVAAPNCGVSWNLLAGIGRIESGHASGGATDIHGTALQPIYGPSLDGSLPGNEVIVQASAPGRVVYARAMGPMQFLPGTWTRYAADGNDDGIADPQNVFDAVLAAAQYLCSGGLNLRDQAQVLTAILRYNNSRAYADNVLGWAAAYATGVVPTDLPPIVGPAPPIGDVHLEHPEGLGPGSPLNLHGLSPSDPMSNSTLIDLGQAVPSSQPAAPPWLPWLSPPPQPAQSTACTIICLDPQSGPGAPALPPYAAPPVPAAPVPPAPYAVPPAPYAVAPDSAPVVPPPAAPPVVPPAPAQPAAPPAPAAPGQPAAPPPPAPMPAYAVPPGA